MKSYNKPIAKLGATGSAVFDANMVGADLERKARDQNLTLSPEEVSRRAAEAEALFIRDLLNLRCTELSLEQLGELRRLLEPLAGVTNGSQKRTLLRAISLHASITGLPLTQPEHKAIGILMKYLG